MEYTIDFLTGKTVPSNHPSFTEVPENTCDGPGYFLLTDACNAWMELRYAAEQNGIHLKIVSSFRSFDRQKMIWENKWYGHTLTQNRNLGLETLESAEKSRLILQYSAMPGTSRHHWGTDLDMNSVEDNYFTFGKGKEEFLWLNEHAARFGFMQPYTQKGPQRPSGYEAEKWHWSYVPMSKQILREYNTIVGYADITDFAGCETAPELRVIEDYVNGINPHCWPDSMHRIV